MADARGEYWYFDSNVDANKITVPELRSILLKHGVTYPSSAKKPVLVKLFEDSVAPQAAQVQRTHARTKRTTRGIQDVPSSSASTATTEDTEDETLLAPPPSTTRRTSRRTTRGPTEEREEVARAPRGKTPTRAVPAKHSRTTEAEADEGPAVRRTRKSATPVVRDPGADSPFTQENPFQSGSSPPAGDARDRRRRTMGSEQKDRRKSEATRRRTFQPNSEQLDEGIMVPTRRSFNPQMRDNERQEAIDDAGEEFTPEEQLELVRENARAGKTDILPPRRRRQANKATGTLKAMSGTLLLTAAAVFGGAWRQEKIAVGFCGLEQGSTKLAGLEVPDWAIDYLPQCEPCPPHAQCQRGLQLRCDPDFIRRDHPLSLNGLIPIPPTCEPDSEKTRKVNSVADRGVQFLRDRRAQYECGEPDEAGNPVESPDISEAELKERMTTQKSKGITDQEFHELFDRAWPEMTVREEVVETTDGTTGGRQLTSTSLAKLSLACSARRSVRQNIERYLWQIVMMVIVIASGSYGKYSFDQNRAMEERAKQLTSDVFVQLANHAALSIQEPNAYPDPGLSMAQLRDDILRMEFSGTRRQKLWDRVKKKVEFNSNVRAAVRQAPNGDISRMWEWTGPMRLLENGHSSSGKRQSGRFGPSTGMDDSPSVGGNEMREVQKWDEGRPIY